ncbi:hypothetical protein MSG28_001947 [Choristoneura fumiferana]|uniref:Uncharacterized protein n=1 Tax=Choristoneura fumiferana TaxID=7141 RepID=A0ACC0JTH8_CHOFU|nr:hypothetical protein MSG28_001947 [Choristoneura fumiferana]
MFAEKEEKFTENPSLDKTTASDIEEPEYPHWYTKEFFVNFFCSMPEEFTWNVMICIMVLVMVIEAFMETDVPGTSPLDIIYNVVYLVHVSSIVAVTIRRSHSEDITLSMKVGFLMDLVSYLHYALNVNQQAILKLVCYYMRLHRPFRYIWTVENNNMQGSLIVTTLKFIYVCLVLRASCAYMWLHVDSLAEKFESDFIASPGQRLLLTALQQSNKSDLFFSEAGKRFFVALYVINKMFIPIGPSMTPDNDLERLSFLLVMMIGCLVVTGATVASLSSVISIYMRPEENFRTRYRLIIQEMTNSRIPPSLRDKVETFYKMYWHKQRAVSETKLLPSFPPVLPKSVHIDIYFEATQRSRILRDLSYEYLSELAQKMETIHYIPGDSIIKRNSTKDSIIYIAYGDIEMLTAEDDISPMLRFTRGTILTPYGVCTAGGGRAHVEIRAATFCTAHVLRAEDMWRIALKHGRDTGQNYMLLSELQHHMNRVKRHYALERKHEPTIFKSSILHFKRSLMALKETTDENGELLLARTDYLLEVAGCYNMRNRADASLADDADPICLRQTFPCILQPSSSLLTAWNWLVACLIVIICFIYPYYLVFKKTLPLEFRFFDGMMTVVYVLDVIAYLSTGANVEEENYLLAEEEQRETQHVGIADQFLLKPKRSALSRVPITFVQTSSQQIRNYWFALDVLATVPIFGIIAEGKFVGINKILRLPKFFQMMKSLEAKCVYHSNIIRFFSYLLLLVIACYLVAAVQQWFMCYQFGHCLVTNFTQPPYWAKLPLDDESVSNRLTFGLYWATSMITFTSHMETWGVEKLTNAFYTMLVLEVSIILHIFIEAVYSATIMVTTAFREDYSACIINVRNFLIRNNVDPQLRQRFITYLELCWYTDKAYSMTVKQSSVFYDLPPHVYQDILARQRSKYILCIPFMKLLRKEDLKNISSNARMFYTSPNEILLNTGDISTEMYVIKQGMCQILNPDTKEVVGSLLAKNHFGVLECLLRLPAFYTVRACTHVQVFSIPRKHLVNAVEIPQIKDAIEFAKEQQEYHRLLTRREPFMFYQPPPPVPTKETFKLPRKHEKDLAFLQPFKKLGFFSVLRYTFPRYTFRPDSVFLTRYELFRALCAFASAMLFPSYSYMVLQFPSLRWITVLLDMLALADTFFRMLIGYFDENGILVYHPASTAAHYLRGAYLVDIFSCLPLESLETDRRYRYGEFYQVTMTKQVLMMNRLLQLYRLPGALVVLTGHIERQDFRLVLQALPMFLMSLNVLTSLLVFCSVRIYHSRDEVRWAIVPSEDKGGSWIDLFRNSFRFNLTSSPWNLHLSCSFWIVYESTTTGYNNFSPSNLELMNVLILAMVLGAMMMTYVSVRIISIRANVNTVQATFREHMKDLQQFMHHERLSKTLQKELIDYYEYSWDKTGGVECRNVLKLCDQITLRTDAILHLYGPTFAKCPILSHCDVSLLRILGRAVRSVYLLKNTTVVEKNDVVQNLYFVDCGTLDVRTTVNDVSTLKHLAIGSVFGNLEASPTRLPAVVVAMTNVHLLQVNSHAFHHVVSDCDFPSVQRLMAKYRPNNEMYIQGGVREQPVLDSRDRGLSSPIILRSRRRLVKYLHLKNNAVQVYLIVICLLCIYTDVYNTGFQVNSVPMIISLYTFDIGFAFKILLHYSLPYIVEDRTDVKILLMKVKRKYYMSEFKFDVASCLPFELLSFLWSNQPWTLFSWLRLNRVLRIITVHSCLKHFKNHVAGNLISSVTVLFVWFTLFVHAATCLWYFIGLMEARAEPGTSWFYDGKFNCISTRDVRGIEDVFVMTHEQRAEVL